MSGKGLQHVWKSLCQYQRIRACLEIKWDTNWERGFLVYVKVQPQTIQILTIKHKRARFSLILVQILFAYWTMTLLGQVNKSILTYSSITKEQLKNPKYYNILHHYQNRTQKIWHPYLQEHSKGGNATQKGTTLPTSRYRWWEQ